MNIVVGEPIGSGSSASLADDGFRVIAGAVPAALLDDLLLALMAAGDTPRPFADPALREPSQRLQFAPAIVAALREALDDEPLAMTCNYFVRSPALTDRSRSALGPHTHDREIVTDPPGRFLLCWTALQDIAMAGGPMWVARGSHRRATPFQTMLHQRLEERRPGELARMRARFVDGIDEADLVPAMDAYHAELDALLVDETREVSPVLLNAGDALLFDPALVHGTLPPTLVDGTAPLRLSFLSRYVGGGCDLHILPPWQEGVVAEERYRLPRRREAGRHGHFYRDYVEARIDMLGVRRTRS